MPLKDGLMRMIKYELNPFNLILDVCNKLYPDTKAQIIFSPPGDFETMVKEYNVPLDDEELPCGFTFFPDDDTQPLIVINSDIPCHAAIEIISHEIAHVIAGYDAGHGGLWQVEFDKIHQAYCKAYEDTINDMELE